MVNIFNTQDLCFKLKTLNLQNNDSKTLDLFYGRWVDLSGIIFKVV